MAIIKQVWNARLLNHANPHDEAAAELAVVRQDRDDETLFSIVETAGGVRRRVTFSLTSAQALDLARFLAGISAARPVLPVLSIPRPRRSRNDYEENTPTTLVEAPRTRSVDPDDEE